MSPAPRATPHSIAHSALLGAILIGGASRRMGRPKHLLVWRGETLVERTTRLLDLVVPSVVMVGAGDLPESLAARPRLRDAPGLRGPAAGIVAALESRPGAGALVVACDQPLLSERLLRWLVERRVRGAVAVQSRSESGDLEPFPGIYEAEALGPLRRLGGGEGAAAALRGLAALAPVATPALPAELARELRGANSPAEWDELAAAAGSAPEAARVRGA
jgi:molybdopterin-guanine dinucleotide biosynthesis protein A